MDTHPLMRALGRVLMALAVVALAVSCGSHNDSTGTTKSDEPAARLVRNQTAVSCDAPPFPPSTRTPDGEDPLANVVLPTPQPPDPQSVGAPSKQVWEQVNAAIRNFVSCWNQRKFEAVATLATPNLMRSIFQEVKPADVLTDMNGLPDVKYDIQSVGDLQQHLDGRVSLAFHYIFVHQHRVGRWYFIKQNGWWILDREARTTPQLSGEQSVIDVEAKDYSYTFRNLKVGPVTVLHAHNIGPAPHEFILLRINEGAKFDPLKFLQPGVKPDGVEFYSQTVLDAGQQEDLVLSNVQPGQYIMLCLLRTPGGIFHPAAGMVSMIDLE